MMMKTVSGNVVSVALMSLMVSLLGSASVMAADPCGQLDGQASETDSSSSITRIITRFQTANGPHYTYEILFGSNVAPASGAQGKYKVSSILNGKTSNDSGVLYNTVTDGIGVSPGVSGGGSVASESCGDEGINSNTVTPNLFFYAADGDHLNAWQGSFQAEGGPVVKYSFPQEAFKDLPWNK